MSRDQVSVGALAPLVGYHLRRAWGAFSADFTAAMEGTGLRQVPFAVLSVVAANPGINQGAVGRILGIKRANMVSLINELVEKGVIDRAVDANDRRAFSLNATPQGNVLLAEAVGRIERHEQGMLADMTPAERSTLLDLLARIERRSPPTEADDGADA
ncbi:MarR family transcriptional regulator [Sphingomonas piscis]|uniref:MarR family transcriptional regulator n=1 Tax=Sphingomonas piscis TaxID=2714943 RepID=A0A6G7YM23_9SPHN|nr:MarR family transcriptional regulator [Sphingomonas piscis]QIK77794.1 MarR family transcriptional regulator [Sphingomonas piscis]